MNNTSIVGCTGHRPQKIPNYNYDSLYNLALRVLEELQPAKVISGMALGWDTAIAQAALNLDIVVEAAVPFKNQDARWSDSHKQLYRNMLDSCEVVIVDELDYYNPGKTPGYASWKLIQRNYYIIDRLRQYRYSKLLAYYDASITNSGSASCVKSAKSNNVEVINYWDK